MGSVPKKCRAAVVLDSQKISTGEIDVPIPAASQALVRVHAAGINHADIYQRKAEYPVPPGASPILGLEIAGEIVSTGSGFRRFSVGDRVMALVPGGAYAEYCVIDDATTMPLPKHFSFVQGAAIPESYFTVWSNIFDSNMAGLQPGETLLVHGGASGVGSVTVQLAKHQGAVVIATGGSPEKCEAIRRLGADAAIPYKSVDFSEEIKRITSGKGVDVIFDWIGTAYFAKHLELLRRFGRLVLIDSHSDETAPLDLLRLISLNLHVMGSVLRRRPIEEKNRIREQVERLFLPALSAGQLDPLIHGTFELTEAQSAHDLMERSGHTGKIVLTL
jgi:NADPH:quinone reductase